MCETENGLLIGSHVSISGGLAGAAAEAAGYGANTFMVYTGAPQNASRKPISGMKVDEGRVIMRENGIAGFVVHAPYIVNPANFDQDKFDFAVSFLIREARRTAELGSSLLVLHPGSAGKESPDLGLNRVIECLDEILAEDGTDVTICLETMAGKGGEVGRDFEELAALISGVKRSERLGVCFDTCHVHDAGYDIINDLDGVMEAFDATVGLDRIKVFHLNGSLNPRGARKDRHANLGADETNPKGRDHIGMPLFRQLVSSEYVKGRHCILETPWISDTVNLYKEEIAALRGGRA